MANPKSLVQGFGNVVEVGNSLTFSPHLNKFVSTCKGFFSLKFGPFCLKNIMLYAFLYTVLTLFHCLKTKDKT